MGVKMVRKIKGLYKCAECKMVYKNRNWAVKCEGWCKKNKSCNLEIIKHALKK
jgi:hypothetical protein